MDGEKILTMLKSCINDDAKAEEIYEKIFELTKEIVSEKIITEHSDNYSNNWDLDRTQKSISLVSYRRGMNKTLKLLFPNKNFKM
jgi:hypothetical protein